MPIYEYQCESEGHRFEVTQPISSRPLSKCNICGGTARNLISATSFSLKGGGWYRDGYAATNGKKKTESGEAKPAPAAKPETKSDSTPATAAKS